MWRFSKRNLLAKTALLAALLALLVHPLVANTLQHQVDTAIAAFGEGNYSQTYWTFENIELDYGQEPEFLDPNFQSAILPVRAYTALMADRPTDALVFFRILLTDHQPRLGVRAFAQYNYAIALAQTNSLAAAADAFARFQENFPDSNEAALAKLQQAELLHDIGETPIAMKLLEAFYHSEAPTTLRMQAQLRALQIASDRGETSSVERILFGTNWNVSVMPDIAVLSFAALDAGDLLIGEGRFLKAISAYRLTLPRDILIKKQHERLESTRLSFSQQAVFGSSIWKSHINQLITRLERQLEGLQEMDDYTAGLYLRSGQAYLLGSRYREASILFKTLALGENYEKNIRAEAHYRWIVALSESEKWETARATARIFLDFHPDHTLAKSALFLIARAHQREGHFYDAIDVLDTLIENYPKDKQAPRWYFTRGYNYSALEQQSRAREDFEAACENYPKSELATQLKMWRGLTYFFERDYKTSLEALLSLRKSSKKHTLYPEINYRIAHIYYAQRDYVKALDVINYLILHAPNHWRFGEALALKGDILMGLGELNKATDAFRKVPPDKPKIFDYAVFQVSKIYKATERYDLMREHLISYVDRTDANESPRLSEALYWIGWSYRQEERAEEAFPLYENTLKRFGDDPKARSVSSILQAYSELFRKRKSAALDFDTWLQEASEKSLSENKLTWFARLNLYKAGRQRRNINDATADATLLSIHRVVPLSRQSPEALAKIGIVLVERGYKSSDVYFEELLNQYPDRLECAAAYYGKASFAAQNGRLNEAQRWLIRFLEETPTHLLAADARLLAADLLMRQGVYQEAKNALNEILKIKEMRGKPYAKALAGLARIEMTENNPSRAIPYWQRIYTLYRAYPSLIAEAYWESAQLFEKIGDPIAAKNTIVEMLRDDRLSTLPQYDFAKAALPRFQTLAMERTALLEQTANTKTEVEQ